MTGRPYMNSITSQQGGLTLFLRTDRQAGRPGLEWLGCGQLAVESEGCPASLDNKRLTKKQFDKRRNKELAKRNDHQAAKMSYISTYKK